MQVAKSVWQYHDKGDDFKPVFEYFKYCSNEAIRIGLEENITSKYALRKRLYHQLRIDSKFHCKYVYGAVFAAAAKLKMYRRMIKRKPDAKIPRFRKNYFVLYSETCKIENDSLRIPMEPGRYIFIRLTKYILDMIREGRVARFVITDEKLIISYSRLIPERKPDFFIGIDRNLDNVTSFDSRGTVIIHDLSETQRIVAKYTKVMSHFKRNDSRIKRKIFQKYGRLQRNRIQNILHCTSKKVVSQNGEIVMENLKGIRKLFKKGNGKGRKYRRKLNSWSFYELQRQIEYKARWIGLPVKYVRPHGTSSRCAICGSKLVPEEHRQMFCPSCTSIVDRDVNAAKNILLRGIRVMPDGIADEAMMAESGNKQPVTCRVDAIKSANQDNIKPA